jgi:hypothetical protein
MARMPTATAVNATRRPNVSALYWWRSTLISLYSDTRLSTARRGRSGAVYRRPISRPRDHRAATTPTAPSHVIAPSSASGAPITYESPALNVFSRTLLTVGGYSPPYCSENAGIRPASAISFASAT